MLALGGNALHAKVGHCLGNERVLGFKVNKVCRRPHGIQQEPPVFRGNVARENLFEPFEFQCFKRGVHGQALLMRLATIAAPNPLSIFTTVTLEAQLFSMSLAVGTGGVPVFMPAGGAAGQPFSTLFGRPIVASEYGATLGTVGDIMLIDPTQYTLIDKGGIQTATSIHVRFVYDESVEQGDRISRLIDSVIPRKKKK